MGLINLIILSSKASITACKNTLEVEESGKLLAKAQGQLAGSKHFLDIVKENYSHIYQVRDSDIELDEEGKVYQMRAFDDATVKQLEIDRIELEKDEGWQNVEEILGKAISRKQSWLFYEAEKGRDLDYCHGWRDGLNNYVDVINDASDEYKSRVRQNPLFAGEMKI